MTGDCCVFNFLRRSVDGKHLMCFQSETPVYTFLRRSVDGASVKQTDAVGVEHGNKRAGKRKMHHLEISGIAGLIIIICLHYEN